MDPKRNSISAHYLESICQGAARRGLSADSVRAQAGIPAELSPQARLTSDQFSRLLLDVFGRADDEFLGLTDQPCRHGAFVMMAKQAVMLDDLRQVYQHIERFYRLVTRDLNFALRVDAGEARFDMLLERPQLDPQTTLREFYLLLMHRFPSWLVGKRIALRRVDMDACEPAHADEYGLIFGQPGQFSQPSSALVFDSAALYWPVVQTRESLRQHLDDAPLTWVTRQQIYPTISRRVSQALRQTQPIGSARIQAVAAQLHMTERTLRRRLADEGTAYQDLKDQVRRDYAAQRLAQPHVLMADVAGELGFSDPGAFSRAFKGWTGQAPRHYRGDR